MINWVLHRVVSHAAYGVFGLWCFPDRVPWLAAVEDPWLPALANVDGGQSCIPAGYYRCRLVTSDLTKKLTKGVWTVTYEITGIPGRSKVRLHPGNTSNNAAGGALDDTRGCVLLGTRFGSVDRQPGVLSSVAAFNEFMERQTAIGPDFGLVVEWSHPGGIPPSAL